jgi:hypothetical protein
LIGELHCVGGAIHWGILPQGRHFRLLRVIHVGIGVGVVHSRGRLHMILLDAAHWGIGLVRAIVVGRRRSRVEDLVQMSWVGLGVIKRCGVLHIHYQLLRFLLVEANLIL